jgi:hypothetical protein
LATDGLEKNGKRFEETDSFPSNSELFKDQRTARISVSALGTVFGTDTMNSKNIFEQYKILLISPMTLGQVRALHC